MECVQIAAQLIISSKRAGSRRGVWMMPGHWQVRDEEPLAALQGSDPGQNPLYRGCIVNSETGMHIPSDGPGIFQNFEAAILDNRRHPEIHESPGMKQRGAITRFSKLVRKRRAWAMSMSFGGNIERGI